MNKYVKTFESFIVEHKDIKNEFSTVEIKLLIKSIGIDKVKTTKVKKYNQGFGHRDWTYQHDTIGKGYNINIDKYSKTFTINIENVYDSDERTSMLEKIVKVLTTNGYKLVEVDKAKTRFTFSFILENISLVSDDDINFIKRDSDISKGFQVYDREKNNPNQLRSDFSGVSKYGLTDNEAKVIFSYTYGGYTKLNSQILNNNLDEIYTKYYTLLIKCLNKLPNYTGIVYRKINMKNIGNYKVDEILQWDVLSSCTKNIDLLKEFNGNVSFEIECLNGKDVSTISIYSDEEEVLLLPSIFEIKEIDGNLIKIKQQ